jgi:lauroyl/myristoyl acyltransferase
VGLATAYLPKIIQKALATLIGFAVSCYNQKKGVAKYNIQLCFPSLSSSEVNQLLSQNSHHIGRSFIEWCKAWFWSDAQMKRYFRHRVEGLEILNKAKNRGVLLVVKHTAHFYVDARILGLYKDYGIVVKTIGYSDQLDDAYVDAAKRAARLGVAKSNQPMKIARWLKSGEVVAYAVDQDYGIDSSVICDFFGVPAATITAPFKLQKAYRCRVCYLNSYYDESGIFVLSIHELSGLDQEDPAKCMQQINNAIASGIRKHPSQYLWSYDRFRSFKVWQQMLRYSVNVTGRKDVSRLLYVLRKNVKHHKYRDEKSERMTTSAWVINKNVDKVLALTYSDSESLNSDKHAQKQWCALGSKLAVIPDCTNTPWVALMQARQISGINDLKVLSTGIFHVDIQTPQKGENPRADFTFLLQADCQHPLKQPGAPFTLEWVDLATPQIKCPSFIRLANKTRAYLAENANLAATT